MDRKRPGYVRGCSCTLCDPYAFTICYGHGIFGHDDGCRALIRFGCPQRRPWASRGLIALYQNVIGRANYSMLGSLLPLKSCRQMWVTRTSSAHLVNSLHHDALLPLCCFHLNTSNSNKHILCREKCNVPPCIRQPIPPANRQQ